MLQLVYPLSQVGFWDSKERMGTLSIKEVAAKEAARAEFCKWVLLEEVGDRSQGRFG